MSLLPVCLIAWLVVFLAFGTAFFAASDKNDGKAIWFASMFWPITLAAIPVLLIIERLQNINNVNLSIIRNEFPDTHNMDIDNFKNRLAKLEMKKLKLLLKFARKGTFNLSGPQMVAVREELISRATEKALLKY